MTGKELLNLLNEQEVGEYIKNSGAVENGRLLKLIAGNYDEINQESFDNIITDLIGCYVITANSQRHNELLVYRPS